MCNAGQACIAPDYVFAHESVMPRYVDALVKEITAMYNPRGEGFDKNPEYPRVINARHFERIKALVEDARAKGAKIVMGGEFRAEDRSEEHTSELQSLMRHSYAVVCLKNK